MNPLKHVAIIMDGNGRWGLKYKNSRNAGHKAGLKTVEKIIGLIDFNEYKRRQAPLGVKISDRNFDKGRRYPITNSWKPNI